MVDIGPVFQGGIMQDGAGLGSVLSGGIKRFIAPFLSQMMKRLKGQALRTGSQILGDVMMGQNIKKAATARAKQGAKQVLLNTLQGKGRRRRKRKTAPKKRVGGVKMYVRGVKSFHPGVVRRQRKRRIGIRSKADIFD